MSDKKKKRRGSRAYLDDFRRSASGEYIYTGAVWSRRAGMTRRRQLLMLWLSGAVMLAACAVRGCIPAAGMVNCAYVLLPYAGELLSAVSVIWALVRLSANGEPLREYVYNATAAILPMRAVFAACFAAASLIGELVYFAINGFAGAPLAILHAVCGVCALLVRRVSRAQEWEKSE